MVCASEGDDPKDPNHTLLNPMTKTFSTEGFQFSVRGNVTRNISGLIDVSKIKNDSINANQRSLLNEGIGAKIEQAYVGDLSNLLPADNELEPFLEKRLYGEARETALERNGFDMSLANTDSKATNMLEAYDSDRNSLFEIAQKAHGNANQQDNKESEEQAASITDSGKTGSHEYNETTTVTRSRETVNNENGGTTTTTILKTNSSGHELIYKEIYSESAPDSEGTKVYTVQQLKIYSDGVVFDDHDHSGTVDKHGNKTQITDREPPLWPVGKINPNPLEDDDSAGDKIYTNDVLHLLNSEDPLIDPLHGFDNQFEAYREDVIEALELISASDYGTSTGSWKEKSGMYTGLDLQSFADSNGGTSTGNDWLGDLF